MSNTFPGIIALNLIQWCTDMLEKNTFYVEIQNSLKNYHVKIMFFGQNWAKIVKNTCFGPKIVS